MKASWFDAILVIEDDIPIAAISRDRSAPFYEQVRKMKVGQSFLFPYTRSPVCANLARATGFKFKQRKEGGNHMRIWRIE